MDLAMATERVMSAFADSATDEGLLREFCGGSESAFFQLFTRYERRLIAYLFKYTGDMELSKDVCQETFTKLAQRPPKLLFNGRIKPWLFRVGRNLAIDHMRRRKWEVTAGNDILVDEADVAAAPDEALAGIDDIAMVRRMIARLPDEYRDVVCQRVYGNLTFKEIAAVCEIPLGTALWRMRRALELMREMNDES
jgi:RNA polymerase sigma-70 factor (ECF subfamily)